MPEGEHRDRRGFLLDNLKGLSRFLFDSMSETIVNAGGGARYLRPPGAIDEAAFLLNCTRCGKCAEVCSPEAIKFLPPTSGAAVGTPYIDPIAAACNLCLKCVPACEPAALALVADPGAVRMGTAVLNPETCWAHQGQLCDLCYHRCPFPDTAIRLADGKPEIITEACTGCGLCAYICVSEPGSITVEPRK